MDSTIDILDSLSDIPITNPFTAANSHIRPRSPTGDELEEVRRQTKRRKIEHDARQPPPYDGFKYGYKGQVVQGRLKMEVVSCDGGEYEKHSSRGLYPIQNVLKNDKSVYCSERSRCNLLLKHIGEMVKSPAYAQKCMLTNSPLLLKKWSYERRTAVLLRRMFNLDGFRPLLTIPVSKKV
jgi:hypothetical protein